VDTPFDRDIAMHCDHASHTPVHNQLLFETMDTHCTVLTYDQKTVGEKSCPEPSCNAQFQLVLPMTIDTTCFASVEGKELGHVAWGKAAVLLAAWSAAAAAAAAADSSGGGSGCCCSADNRAWVVVVVVVAVVELAAASAEDATARLGDAVAPETTGALGECIEIPLDLERESNGTANFGGKKDVISSG
jgi:hypothetical protein